MAHVGEIGKRMTAAVTFVKSFDYVDYKFNPRGDVHYTHIFHDADGAALVWKTTKPVEYVNAENAYEFITVGSKVEMTFSVKEHGQYKGADQTAVTRCKFKLISRAKTPDEINREKAADQLATLGENDIVWEMPYAQYKKHYADCETVAGSFDNREDSHGVPQGRPTIKVIIRDGRLKNSGVRGEHYSGYRFESADGERSITYRAVSEENAYKRITKEYPETEWECVEIFDYHTHRIW